MSFSVTADTYSDSKLAIRIKGNKVGNRQPVHLIFLIDVSGSMDGERLKSVKKSLLFLLPLFTEDDMTTLITFGDDSEVLAKAIQMNESGKQSFEKIINRLHTTGFTNMSSALLRVAELYNEDASFQGSPGHKHSILLLTDGHANRGVYSHDELMSIIAKLMNDTPGLSLTTVGYSHDHNESLLKQAATTGSGSYNVVNTLEDVATVFGEVFGGLTTIVAQNVSIQFPDSVVPKTAYSITNNLVNIGDIYSEQDIIVLANNYTGGEVCVRGTNMSDLSSIRIPLTPSSLTGSSYLIELAEFRYQVSELLKNPNSQEAERLLNELRQVTNQSDNLIQMMIEDCETVLEILQTGRTRAAEVEMAQHSAYLGLGRGLRCAPVQSVSPPPQNTWGVSVTNSDPTNNAPTTLGRTRTARVDYTSSPFSNRAQQESVSMMRTRSNPTSN